MTVRPLAFLEEQRQHFGDVFTLRLLNEEPWVAIADPETIAAALRAPVDVLRAGAGKHVLEPILGPNSLLLLDGERHGQQRGLLLPPFKPGRVEGYERAMRAAAERVIAGWPTGRAEPAANWTRAIALEVILHAVFGAGGSRRLTALRKALRELPLPGNARESQAPGFRRALARADELVYAAIDDCANPRRDRAEDSVLSLLSQARHEDGSPMSRREVRDELMSLLVAGYETTATSLAWALERLARNPERLAQVEAEGDGGGPYTDAVVRETLRLRPPVPLIPRAVTAPYAVGDHLIEPGATLMIAALLLHHRADLYPEPHAFRPERFLERPPDPRIWMPFGGGTRRCIGARFAMLEMRVVLATLLAGATVRGEDERPEAMRSRAVTLTPARGAPLTLEPR